MANCLVYIWNAFIKFLWGIFKHEVKVFEKSGMDFQFENIKAQQYDTGIGVSLCSVFSGSALCGQLLGNKFFWGISNYGVKVLEQRDRKSVV